MKIALRLMRELKIEEPAPFGVHAASGLVKSGNDFFVVADDDLSLFQFNFEGVTKVDSIPLKSGVLADDPKERKRQKPDWESLIKLEVAPDENILLAIPSGSTENRMMGAYVKLNYHGQIIPTQNPVQVSFSQLFSELKTKIPDLNLEGACVLNNQLKLFQRGNGAGGINAIIDIDLDGFCQDLKNSRPVNAKHLLAIKKYDLGTLNGYKLDFTDACALINEIWFLAVAEDSQSTYDDGQFHGAILGCLDSSGIEIARYEIDCAVKPEGLWVEGADQKLNFFIVTDADSSTVHASIYFGKKI